MSAAPVELVAYYQREYPLYKFITESHVQAICEKWRLVCGDVSRFKGFVPEKNLRDIENFKLKPADDGLWATNGMFFKNAEIRRDGQYWHIYSKGNSDKYKYAFQRSRPDEPFYGSDSHDLFGYADIGFVTIIDIRDSNLQICAPIADMDMAGMTIASGYKMEKIHVPDPVVLRPVRGGYLIVTAWGDEASDENVVNQNMN